MKRYLLLTVCAVIFASLATETYAARLGRGTTIRPRATAPRTYVPPQRRVIPNGAVRRFNQNQANTQGATTAPVMPLFIPPIVGSNGLQKLNEELYLIRFGIRRKNDEVSFWLLNNKPVGEGKSSKAQMQIQCKTNQARALAGAVYSEPMGKGKELSKGRINKAYQPIQPKTVMSYLKTSLCKKPSSVNNPSAAKTK